MVGFKNEHLEFLKSIIGMRIECIFSNGAIEEKVENDYFSYDYQYHPQNLGVQFIDIRIINLIIITMALM